jgi:hypothetical protein
VTTQRVLHVAKLPKPWSEMADEERLAWATEVHAAFVAAAERR